MPPESPTEPSHLPHSYLIAAAASALTTALLFTLFPRIEQANVAMLFLAALIPVAMKLGRGPASLCAILNVIGFDAFFIEPRFTFVVEDLRFWITFAVMLVVGLLLANLTAGLKAQASIATERERKTRGLYELARRLGAALRNEQIAESVEELITEQGLGDAVLLFPDEHRRLSPTQKRMPMLDLHLAQWCFDEGRSAGIATSTLAAGPLHYLPLTASVRTRGMLVLDPADSRSLESAEQLQHLQTIAALAANALERTHFVAVAQDTLVQIESQRMREMLLAALSHDLRTPITSIMVIAETLATSDTVEGEARTELLTSLRRQTQGMARLVTNLLDMARLETGERPLRLDWQSLEEIIGSARQALADQLRGRKLTVNITPDFPLLHADGVLLERVFVNLLENAVKYVPADMHMGISARTEDDTAVIEVWDEGPGMTGRNLERLFHKFTRGAIESSVPGVGLGLTICRAIVDAHGGAISAANRPDGGASIEIRLPLSKPPEWTQEEESGTHE